MTKFRLDSTYHPNPEPGKIDMVLWNHTDAPIRDFTLSWSSLTRLRRDGAVDNGVFRERVANLHTVACPTDILPGQAWRFTLSGLSHAPGHRLDGPKSGYVTTW